MIQVHRLSGVSLFVNPDLILFLESSPDTVITFRDGVKLPVRESIAELTQLIMQHRKAILPTDLRVSPPAQE